MEAVVEDESVRAERVLINPIKCCVNPNEIYWNDRIGHVCLRYTEMNLTLK